MDKQTKSVTLTEDQRSALQAICRRCIEHVREVLGVSERRACRTLDQHRSTQRKIPCGLPDEERLTEYIIALTREYGRYGYRMIAGMLNNSASVQE